MDMQEGHEDWVKEIPNSKRPRYQGPSMSVASGSTRNKDFGSIPLFKEEEGPEAEEHG